MEIGARGVHGPLVLSTVAMELRFDIDIATILQIKMEEHLVLVLIRK